MKISKLEVGFTNIISIGICSYMIHCNSKGAFVSVDEIVEKAQMFNKVVFLGEDPLLQKEDVAKIAKKIIKINPRVKIEIQTHGITKPVEISGFINNTTFNIFVPTKRSPNYKIDSVTFSWYSEIGANFIFEIEELSDIDNAVMLMNSVGIKKAQVYLTPLKHIDNLQRHTKFYGINLAPKVEWEIDEEETGI